MTDIPNLNMAPVASVHEPQRRDEEQLQKAAKQFEGLLLRQLLKVMRSSVPQDGSSKEQSTQMYHAMFDDELAKVLAMRGSLGIADRIMIEMRSVRPRVDDAHGSVGPTLPQPAGWLPALQGHSTQHVKVAFSSDDRLADVVKRQPTPRQSIDASRQYGRIGGLGK